MAKQLAETATMRKTEMAQVIIHRVSPAVVCERIPASPEQIAAFCQAHHIRRRALFGSLLRDDFRCGLADILRRFSARSAQVYLRFREAHAEIAWQETDGMYRAMSEDGIALNDETLWKIATQEIPALLPTLESILPPEMRYPPEEPPRGVYG